MILKLLLYHLVLILIIVFAGRDDKDGAPVYFAVGIMSIFTLCRTVSIGQMVFRSQVDIPPSVMNASIGLLECLQTEYPAESYVESLKQCVYHVQVHNLTKSWMPYIGIPAPIAFVVPRVFDNKMFIVDENSRTLQTIERALVLIHECTHIALDTVDYAYRWQPEFDYLTDKEHENNADSYVDVIIKKCLNGVSVAL